MPLSGFEGKCRETDAGSAERNRSGSENSEASMRKMHNGNIKVRGQDIFQIWANLGVGIKI